MKNWRTKKNVFIVSSVATLFVAALFIFGSDSCYINHNCRLLQESAVFDMLNDDMVFALFVFPPLFLLSLLTYRMHDEVFHVWWNFARWMVPTIVLATFFANMMPSGGGFFNMDALIYPMVLGPLYIALIFGSLWKIVRTHRELKRAK